VCPVNWLRVNSLSRRDVPLARTRSDQKMSPNCCSSRVITCWHCCSTSSHSSVPKHINNNHNTRHNLLPASALLKPAVGKPPVWMATHNPWGPIHTSECLGYLQQVCVDCCSSQTWFFDIHLAMSWVDRLCVAGDHRVYYWTDHIHIIIFTIFTQEYPDHRR